jgi:hypothetical protein
MRRKDGVVSRFSIDLFGREVLSINLAKDECRTDPAVEEPQMAGGGGHNFERGPGAEEYETDVRAFGFVRRS